MGRPRQPIGLLQTKGKKHLTKNEIGINIKLLGEKTEAYYCMDCLADYLGCTVQELLDKIEEFYELVKLEIMGETDNDALARLVIAQGRYEDANELLDRFDFEDDPKAYEIASRIYAKRLDELRKLASDLGLTISSRCKLAVPKKEEDVKLNKFSRFGAAG